MEARLAEEAAGQKWGHSSIPRDQPDNNVPIAPETWRKSLSLEWAGFIARYDKPFTLFYLDPPYWGEESEYGKGAFVRDDYARMADLLARINGRFILSLNDRLELREQFAAFRIETVTTRYTGPRKATRSAVELLISN